MSGSPICRPTAIAFGAHPRGPVLVPQLELEEAADPQESSVGAAARGDELEEIVRSVGPRRLRVLATARNPQIADDRGTGLSLARLLRQKSSALQTFARSVRIRSIASS